MQWYTQNDGQLCLGKDLNQANDFYVATEVTLDDNISMPLLQEHIELIGSQPKDWHKDSAINNKINNTAKHFFGFNNYPKSATFT